MLEVLRISNFAIIEQVEVEFGPGLTAITGETGAGKSIVMDALRLILGDRATSEVVRTGASRSTIEGLFRIRGKLKSWLEQAAFCETGEEEDHVIVRREILASGTSRNFINNRSATLAQLRELGAQLVDLHGQNEHTALISQANQLQFLDDFGGYPAITESYQAAYQAYQNAVTALASLETGIFDAERRKSFLAFQVDEIQKADLKPGEDETLEIDKKRLASAERIASICQTACDLLYEGDQSPAMTQLAAAAKSLLELGQLDPTQEPLAKEAESIRFAVVDLYEKIRDYVAAVQPDPQRLSFVEDRLQAIRDLKKKYGPTVAAILDVGSQMMAELELIENQDIELAKLRQNVHDKALAAWEAAEKLSLKRRTAAQSFEKSVQKVMRELELPRAELRIKLDTIGGETSVTERAAKLTSRGADTVEFLITLNAGEELRPLRKVASGGEMSRIMLAIKSVAAGRDSVPTLIFDEIDTGISGQAATRVGDKLAELGQSHQVICITHLPQIAARGDKHFIVEKRTVKGRTFTEVHSVEGDARKTALAQMLAGTDVDEESQRFAEKLLEKTRKS
jgi:DNA repair protein RecN (Recombination protein N)